MPIVDGELVLRPFRDDDEAPLLAMMDEPAVRRWWPVPELVREQGWVIELGGRAAGWLEYHEEPHRWYPSVAFDIFLTTDMQGRGYGSRALRMAIDHFTAKGHHRFTLDPNAANERAIGAYASIGFERVGVMRAYERNPSGGWNDALLMELIVAAAMGGAGTAT
jgi:aminoglycoside 6'-N-acetyltransferase